MAEKKELEVGNPLKKYDRSKSQNFDPFKEEGCQLQVYFSPSILDILLPILQNFCFFKF